MVKTRKLTRRRFIQLSASIAAAGHAISCSKATNPWRFLTIDEAATLQAICGQIVPTDADPGAKEVGVVNFIDLQLVGYLKRHQKSYREGLAGVDQPASLSMERDFPNWRRRSNSLFLLPWRKTKRRAMSGSGGRRGTFSIWSSITPCRDSMATRGMAAIGRVRAGRCWGSRILPSAGGSNTI